jgi:hypothetical protein
MDRRVQAAVAAWSLTFLVMTVVFPYVGARGGFFHSGAALQPLWWAAAPLGLVALIRWIGERRHWNLGQAKRFFGIGLIGLAVLISVIVYLSRVIGSDFFNPSWAEGYDRYTRLEAALVELGIRERDVVMVNNPPGYYLASGRQAVSIPYGDLETVFKVAERYRARYLLLEIDQIHGQENLYTDPGDHPGISYLGSVDGTRIYQFQLP